LPKVPTILCGGIAVQDIVMRVRAFPAPGTKVSASDFIITGGGCAANAALAVARLGGRAVFAGPLGGEDDAVSQWIVADLSAEGVDCRGAVRVEGGTASVSLILLDAEGEKSIATRRGTDRRRPRWRGPWRGAGRSSPPRRSRACRLAGDGCDARGAPGVRRGDRDPRHQGREDGGNRSGGQARPGRRLAEPDPELEKRCHCPSHPQRPYCLSYAIRA